MSNQKKNTPVTLTPSNDTPARPRAQKTMTPSKSSLNSFGKGILGRTACRHNQNADHLHTKKGSEMSTRATGGIEEAGQEAGGVGMSGGEHLQAA